MVTPDNIDEFLAGGEEEIPGVTDEMEATQSWKIAYIIKNTINPFWVRTMEGAVGAGEDFGAEVTVLAPQKPDNVEEQIRIVEDVVQQGVDGICITPTDTKGLAPTVEKAIEAGIPVIVHNTPLASDMPLTFVGFDSFTAGTAIGEWVAGQLGGSGKVLILEGPPGHQNANERREGFLNGLDKGGEFEVMDSQTAQWHRSEALRITEDWLQRFPEIDAIIAANDEMGLGASEAVQAAGREGIIITGFDANNDALQAIKEGKMHVTVDQVPGKQSRQAVQLMIQHLESDKSKSFPESLPWGDITMVTPDNIDEFLPE
jgi:ribose transport system substrate-binding protein